MCSARWLTLYSAPRAVCSTLPAPQISCRDDQERHQHVGDLGEVADPGDQVVLVAAVGVAVAVGVVLEQVDVAADALAGQPLLGVDDQVLEDPLAGPVVVDQLDQVVALGGRVLRVRADVEIDPGSVAQEDVAAAAPGHDPAEQVAGHLVRGQPPGAAGRAGDAVLGLQPDRSAGPSHLLVTSAGRSRLMCRGRQPLVRSSSSAQLVAGQLPELPDLQSAQPDRPDPGPRQPAHRVADRVHRTADDPVPALVQRDLDQRLLAGGRDELDRRRPTGPSSRVTPLRSRLSVCGFTTPSTSAR